MANELPSNVSYGTVIGRFILAYADSSDPDLFPDGVPAKGNIYFTPMVEKLRNATGTPAPVTIIPREVVCSLDSNGFLVGPDGSTGVRLIATDDIDNTPIGWKWKVEYRLTDQSDVLLPGIASHEMDLPGGTTVDLITVSPVAGLVS